MPEQLNVNCSEQPFTLCKYDNLSGFMLAWSGDFQIGFRL